MKKALIFIIHVYQGVLSPLFPSSCRYIPTCSSYAIEAINKHGALKGVFLSLKRILHCAPWGGYGHDPVP
ncbi:MAG: membrane protein insertion efficiency factor YidD [Bacteroidota bacterium]|nr:membrane protein insertion efficiency factor YidD [Bacteroidota bacterium]